MKYDVIIRPEAEMDIELIAEWYEFQRNGLGHEFLMSLDDGINLIANHPEIYQARYRNTRICLLHRFPYGIYYFIKEKRVIIFAIQHHKRNNSNWKKRI